MFPEPEQAQKVFDVAGRIVLLGGEVVVPCSEHFILFHFISFYIFHIFL